MSRGSYFCFRISEARSDLEGSRSRRLPARAHLNSKSGFPAVKLVRCGPVLLSRWNSQFLELCTHVVANVLCQVPGEDGVQRCSAGGDEEREGRYRIHLLRLRDEEVLHRETFRRGCLSGLAGRKGSWRPGRSGAARNLGAFLLPAADYSAEEADDADVAQVPIPTLGVKRGVKLPQDFLEVLYREEVLEYDTCNSEPVG